MYPDVFVAAALEKTTANRAKSLWVQDRIETAHLEKWAHKYLQAGDVLVLEASGNSFEVASRLHALVFYYRDVLKRELGDFSDDKKAAGSKRISAALSVDEIRLILAEMTPTQASMAKLQYGAGLRISELVRLRINDVDFENRQTSTHSTGKSAVLDSSASDLGLRRAVSKRALTPMRNANEAGSGTTFRST